MDAITRRLVPVALAATIALGGCSGPSTPQTEVLSQGRSMLPTRSAEDIVTYGDAVVLITVASEAALPSPELPPGQDSTMVLREIGAVVQKVLWQAPDAPNIATDDELTLGVQGWLRRATGDDLPLRLEGTQRVEVGRSYVAALVYDFAGLDDGWVVYDPSAVAEVVDDVVTRTPEAGAQSYALAFLGGSLSDATAVLQTTRVSSDAQRWAGLPAMGQAQAVAAERELVELEQAFPAEADVLGATEEGSNIGAERRELLNTLAALREQLGR